MSTFSSICLLSLLSLVAGSPAGQHSLEKRQTTVTYSNTLPEVFSSSVHAVVSLALVSVIWFTVAPIFGLTVFGTRRSSTSDHYGLNHYPFTSSAAGGYYDYSDPGYQYESPYYAQGRSLNLGNEKRGGALARIGRMLNSIDLVEAGLDFAGVEEQACRLRTICEVEQAAANNPFARLAINTINSNLSGLSKYQEAVNAGLGGQDCSLLYSQCPLSYARAFTSLL